MGNGVDSDWFAGAALPFKMGPLGSPKTNYWSTLHNIPEEWRSDVKSVTFTAVIVHAMVFVATHHSNCLGEFGTSLFRATSELDDHTVNSSLTD